MQCLLLSYFVIVHTGAKLHLFKIRSSVSTAKQQATAANRPQNPYPCTFYATPTTFVPVVPTFLLNPTLRSLVSRDG